MLEIGHVLRQAREEQGLSLEEISSSTMIPKKHLRALETEEFDVFPGEVYLKGALRQYAKELKLDPEELLNRYSGTTDQPEQKEAPPKAEKAVKAPVLPTNVNFGRVASRLHFGRLALYSLVVVLLVLVIWTVGGLLLSDRPPATDPPPIDNGQNDPSLPGDNDEELDPQQPEVRIVPDEQDPLLFHLYNAETIEAELTFNARCWVRVHVDGTELFEETFSAGDSRSITADQDMLIRIGYPRGAGLTINGLSLNLPESGSAINININNAGTD
jgi:cytoskeletal protein RodZ